jgi:uncharacterized short protein YbdD (DUF466 family)
MTEAVIQRLRRLQSLGIVTSAHCIRAERSVERHPEIFSGATSMTVSEAVQWAIQTARLMVGIPDYQTYLRHQPAFHRGEPVMTYEEFFRERQDAHYMPSKGGFRGIG